MVQSLDGLLCIYPNNVFVINYYNSFFNSNRNWPSDSVGNAIFGSYIHADNYYYCTVLYDPNHMNYGRAPGFILKELDDDCIVMYQEFYTFLKYNHVDRKWQDWALKNLDFPIVLSETEPVRFLVPNLDYYLRIRPGHFDDLARVKDIVKILLRYPPENLD